ncbi:MAG TPA: hypothetical protein VN109_10820 [Devosia sp.]|jgi:hypothetical protein|nr:hypothetical protein [Devosia sp.]
MSVASELTRLKRDIDSLAEEIAVNSGPRAKAPLSAGERRSLKAEMQALIQRLDELSGKLSG